jgi:hypothetical protein
VFTSVVVNDTFDRANSAVSLGTADTGQAWTAHVGTWGISSNQGYLATTGGGSRDVAALDALAANAAALVTLATVGSGTLGVNARLTDSLNYLITVFHSGSLFIQKVDAGATTTLSSKVLATANGDVLKLTASGNALVSYVNDVEQLNASDAFNNTATSYGLISYADTAARFNNFQVLV